VYSNFPFRSRDDSPPRHAFGIEALEFYQNRENAGKAFARVEKLGRSRVLRYAVPLIMKKNCLDCHNDRARYEPPARCRPRDWEVDEVRGVLEIVRPLEEDYAQMRQTLLGTYGIVGGGALGLLAVCWLVFAVGRRLRG
jgi:hypothetical protein